MRIVCTLFFLLIHLCTFAQSEQYGQYEQILHKPYKDIAEDIDKLTAHVNGITDSTSEMAYIDGFKIWAEKNNDPQLAIEAEMIRALYYLQYDWSAPERVRYFMALAKKGKEENLPILEVRAVMNVAVFYWDSQDYQNAFQLFMRSSQILDRIDPEDFPKMTKYLNFIGDGYYYFRDYRSARPYFERASVIKKTSYTYLNILGAQNTLGLCYQKMGQFEVSNQWFTKIIGDTTQYRSLIWIGIASGNLGYNYYLQDKYEKAIPLLKTDIEYAINEKIGIIDYGLAAGSTIPLADIYLKRNQLEKSKKEIDAAKEYIRISRQTDRLRKLYPVMSRWFARRNQIDSSEAYLDSARLADEKYSEKFNSLKLLRANQEFEARQKELEVAQLKTESQLKLAQRNLITAITVLLLIGSLLTLWFRNKYLLKKQQIKDLALINTRESLVNAKSQLENMVQRVNQNNEMIIQLQKGTPQKEDIDLLERLKSTSILTHADWDKYQEMFEKAYPNFLPNLESSYPDLSPAERRCLCLEKLQMSNNDIALVLGVSANTVIVTKYRIRKKLGLGTQKGLTDLIERLV